RPRLLLRCRHPRTEQDGTQADHRCPLLDRRAVVGGHPHRERRQPRPAPAEGPAPKLAPRGVTRRPQTNRAPPRSWPVGLGWGILPSASTNYIYIMRVPLAPP